MSRRNVKYSKIPTVERDCADGYTDEQFAIPKQKVPWKAIILATILCVGGLVTLVTGSLIVSGHIHEKYGDRMWPLIILGAIMFIPGAYHIRIAYLAFRKKPGYSFDDIPEFD